MSSNPQPIVNPLTDMPFEGIKDMERVVAGLTECFIENPDFRIVEGPLRTHQLISLNRGFGYVALTPNTEKMQSTQENERTGPMIHVLDVTDNPIGETWDNVLRLTEQGQAISTDSSTSDLEKFARLHSTWRPSSIAERNTALTSLGSKLTRSLSLPLEAVERVLQDAEKWLGEARSEEQALALTESEDEMAIHDKAILIRSNDKVFSAIINIRLNSYIFERGKTMQKNKAPYNKLANEVRNEVVALDDGQLVYMWDTALDAATHRRRFWEEQVRDISKDPRVEIVKRDRLQRAQQ